MSTQRREIFADLDHSLEDNCPSICKAMMSNSMIVTKYNLNQVLSGRDVLKNVTKESVLIRMVPRRRFLAGGEMKSDTDEMS